MRSEKEDQTREHPPRISLVAALARNRVIGRGGELPWRLAEDLKRFKSLTLGHPVVMGRKTHESIVAISGKPLPGRDNIVITRSAGYKAPGCHIVITLGEALAVAAGSAEAFVIGGGEIYALALPVAHRLYLTELDANFEGDAFFPEFDRGAWWELSRETRIADGPGGFRYHFVIYERLDSLSPPG